MKRNVFSKVLVVFLICLLSVAWNLTFVYGDVIWEPEDSFFKKEKDDTVYVDRTYFTNGEKGYVTVYKNPNSNKIVADFENGVDFYISYTIMDKKGEEWGIIEYEDGDGDYKSGWIHMDDLIVRYDDTSFCEDHANELTDYDGTFDYSKYEDEIIIWQYPGSGVIAGYLPTERIEEYPPEFAYMYTDHEGKKWAYFGYYMGSEGWICLTDPTNDDLPVIKVEYRGLIPASKPDKTPVQKNISWVFLGLVAGLVIITVILIKVFYGNKNNGQSPNG